MNAQELTQFWFHEFGACGCGMPEKVVGLVRDVLALIADTKKRGWEKTVHDPADYVLWETEMVKLLPTDGALYFVFYQLDHHGLIEHGSSVPGWITPRGKGLLEAIQKYGVDSDGWVDQ